MDDWLRAAARRRPDHPALVTAEGAITYAELDAAASTVARRLAGGGVAAGDRVVAALPPDREFAELLHALPRLGAVLEPVDPSSEGAAPLPAREQHEVDLRLEHEPDEIHCVIHTSGTTGAPKPVELTYGNHQASAVASAELIDVGADDRWLCVLPVFHIGGLAIFLRSAIYATTAVVHGRFDAERVKHALEEEGITIVSLVPTMLERLRAAGLDRPPGLRAVLLGGGPIPPGLLDWALEAGLPVMPTYGMTEAASQIATAKPGERWARPLAGVELRIADEGEVLVRGPMVAPGARGPDGWLHTGDAGRLDEHGRLRIEGRLKELIVTGGENVSPVEVERALLEHPAVKDAGVVGVPDPEWGEAVTAFVVLEDGAVGEGLEAHCRERLAPHKVPKRIEQVPGLPRTRGGKLLRSEIAG